MRKKHTYADRLKCMRMIEAGYGMTYIQSKYGISKDTLGSLWIRYQQEGPSALKKRQSLKVNGAFREEVIRTLEENNITLYEASVRFNISVGQISLWRRIVKQKGVAGLYEPITRRHPSNYMGRPKKKKPEEMTELERLRYDNERLRAENALLKKVRALVEEREARLRAIGQKPSKD